MKYDAIVVGGGMAGLTAAAYLAKARRSVLLCEKEAICGGLVNTFERDGFFFDGGIRATENSGALFPMLRQLGLEIPFVRNRLSIGLGNRVIRLNRDEDVILYRDLLHEFYPESQEEIDTIMAQVKQIMHYMEVQYGIDNPVFLDLKKNRDYFIKVIMPWMVQYALTVPKINKFQVPVVDFLFRYTQNKSLVDIISQHFFQKTPAFFALSYFKLYLDYHYPLGGTGRIPAKLAAFIQENGGIIHTNTKIVRLDPYKRVVTDENDERYEYRRLIWAADQNVLYRVIDTEKLVDPRVRKAIDDRKEVIADKRGNDSVLTLFLAVDMDKGYFEKICSEHFFYTAVTDGQTAAGPLPLGQDRAAIEQWLKKFFALTTYEISIPVLRDPSMAPDGKTGLIISVLFDYPLTKTIQEMGWYEEFRILCEECILDTLAGSIYPGLREAIVQRFLSTPMTIARYAGSTDGAIVGWAFTNDPLPAENRLPKILNAVRTQIPHVFQAGQWTYSPSGLPIALITGKLAADQSIKDLKKEPG